MGTKHLNAQNITEKENGLKYTVKVTNKFAALEEIDKSDDNENNRQ